MAYGTQRFAFGYQLTPWVKRLLIANTFVFLLTMIVGQNLLFNWFGFSPSDALTRPWGAVTYMFLHGGIWHLLANMIGLFFFGPPLESRWGSSEFLKYYLLCGLGGVVLSFVFAPAGTIIGASAAVYAIMLAFAWHWPEVPIYIWGIFPVKAKWVVAAAFVLVFINAFGGAGGGVAHFAHLGGLLTGLGYLKFGGQLGAKLGEMRSSSSSERFAIVPRKESREEEDGRSSRKSQGRPRSMRKEEELLDEVDRILDKISARGMSALTEEERKVLDEVSRKRRSN
ncbi:MAG: rhomboid family intramembrane serine protease [Gemmatimonadota bacterium]